MAVSQIDPEGSGSLPETAAVSGSEPDHKGSIPTPTQNKLIILVVPQQFYKQNTFTMMQNVCFCLKGECFSNLLAIFVVLIM